MPEKRERVVGEENLYLKGDTYFAVARTEGRAQQWKSLTAYAKEKGEHVGGKMTLTQAKRLRDAYVTEVRNGTAVRYTTERFIDVGTEWLREKHAQMEMGDLSLSTYTGYEGSLRRHVFPYFAHKKISGVTRDDILAWREWAMKGCGDDGKPGSLRAVEDTNGDTQRVRVGPQKDWSMKAHYMALRMTIDFAQRTRRIAFNPIDELEARQKPRAGKKRVRYLEAEEIAVLLAAAEERNAVTLLAVRIAVFCGLRLGEIRGIRWKDVDLDRKVLYVEGQLTSKNSYTVPKTESAVREVVLMDELASAFREYKLAAPRSKPMDYVFATETNATPVNQTTFGNWLRDTCKGAELEDVTYHILRHTFASILIFQGHNVVHVANQMGHAKPSMTLDRYAHLFGRAANADMQRRKLSEDFGHLFEAPERKLVALR